MLLSKRAGAEDGHWCHAQPTDSQLMYMFWGMPWSVVKSWLYVPSEGSPSVMNSRRTRLGMRAYCEKRRRSAPIMGVPPEGPEAKKGAICAGLVTSMTPGRLRKWTSTPVGETALTSVRRSAVSLSSSIHRVVITPGGEPGGFTRVPIEPLSSSLSRREQGKVRWQRRTASQRRRARTAH